MMPADIIFLNVVMSYDMQRLCNELYKQQLESTVFLHKTNAST